MRLIKVCWRDLMKSNKTRALICCRNTIPCRSLPSRVATTNLALLILPGAPLYFRVHWLNDLAWIPLIIPSNAKFAVNISSMSYGLRLESTTPTRTRGPTTLFPPLPWRSRRLQKHALSHIFSTLGLLFHHSFSNDSYHSFIVFSTPTGTRLASTTFFLSSCLSISNHDPCLTTPAAKIALLCFCHDDIQK